MSNKKQIELAKRILESKGYTVLKESDADGRDLISGGVDYETSVEESPALANEFERVAIELGNVNPKSLMRVPADDSLIKDLEDETKWETPKVHTTWRGNNITIHTNKSTGQKVALCKDSWSGDSSIYYANSQKDQAPQSLLSYLEGYGFTYSKGAHRITYDSTIDADRGLEKLSYAIQLQGYKCIQDEGSIHNKTIVYKSNSGDKPDISIQSRVHDHKKGTIRVSVSGVM